MTWSKPRLFAAIASAEWTVLARICAMRTQAPAATTAIAAVVSSATAVVAAAARAATASEDQCNANTASNSTDIRQDCRCCFSLYETIEDTARFLLDI